MDKDGFRLHEYEIRPTEGVIVGPGGQLSLPREAMEVLLHLAEHAGEVVDPNTLLRIADADNLQDPVILSNCIKKLRNQLADNDESPRFIQKVAERGYRLIAPVIPSDDIVLETGSGPIHVQPMDGNHNGEFLLETSSGPLVLHPLSAEDDNKITTAGGWFAELRRRRVFRAVGAYAVVAWLSLQIVDVLSGVLPVPDRMLPISAAMLGLGFPVVEGDTKSNADGLCKDVSGNILTIAGGKNLDCEIEYEGYIKYDVSAANHADLDPVVIIDKTVSPGFMLSGIEGVVTLGLVAIVAIVIGYMLGKRQRTNA